MECDYIEIFLLACSQHTIGPDMHGVTGALVLYAVEKKIAKE